MNKEYLLGNVCMCLLIWCLHINRAKTSRVITFEEFQKALEELAPKRFKGQSKEEALKALHELIEGKEPTNAGVTVRCAKLCNHSHI